MAIGEKGMERKVIFDRPTIVNSIEKKVSCRTTREDLLNFNVRSEAEGMDVK